MKTFLHRMAAVVSQLLLTIMPAAAKTGDQEAHDQMSRQIQELYNTGNYAGIHDLLTTGFQAQFDRAKVEAFFGQVLQPTYGKFDVITFLKKEGASRLYKVAAEKGVATLSLAVDDQNKILGMKFVPGDPKAEVKRPLRAEPAHDNALKSAVDNKVHKAVADFYRKGATPGLSVGLMSGSESKIYNYGETVRGGGGLPSGSTIYEIGSISKTFTSLLLAQAVEEKKIRLDADVRPLLKGPYPNLEKDGIPIQMVHLANHTSGLPRLADDLSKQPRYNPLQPYQNYDWAMMSKFLGRVQLKTVPGTEEEYSNLGAVVLGHAMESVLGDKYGALVRDRICSPLGMKDSSLEAVDPARFAKGYAEEGEETPAWEMGDWAPAGGIRSTVKDMLYYLEAHLHPRSPIFTKVTEKTWGQGREAVALAWQRTTLKGGDTLVWHNGGTYGFSSFIGFIPSRDTGIVVLGNSGESVDGLAIQLLKQ